MPRSTVQAAPRGRSAQSKPCQRESRAEGSMTKAERAYYARTVARYKKTEAAKPTMPSQHHCQSQSKPVEVCPPRHRSTQASADADADDRQRRHSQGPIPVEGSLDPFLLGILGVSAGLDGDDVMQLMQLGLDNLGRNEVLDQDKFQRPKHARAQRRGASQEPIPVEAVLEPMLIALLGGGNVVRGRAASRTNSGVHQPRLSSQEPIPSEEPIDVLMTAARRRDVGPGHASPRRRTFEPPSRVRSPVVQGARSRQESRLRRLGDWRRPSRAPNVDVTVESEQSRPERVTPHGAEEASRGCPIHYTGKGEKECQICLEEYSCNDDLLVLPCLHKFHVSCIRQWMTQHRTCPICRQAV